MKNIQNWKGLFQGAPVFWAGLPDLNVYEDFEKGDLVVVLFGTFKGFWVGHKNVYGSQWTGSYEGSLQWKFERGLERDEALLIVEQVGECNIHTPRTEMDKIAFNLEQHNGGPLRNGGPLSRLASKPWEKSQELADCDEERFGRLRRRVEDHMRKCGREYVPLFCLMMGIKTD